MGKERSTGDKFKDKGAPSPHRDEYYDTARIKEEGWEATLTDEQKEIEAKKQKKREAAALKSCQNQKSDARKKQQWDAWNVSKRLDGFVYNATTEHTGPVDSNGASLAAPKVGSGGKTKISDRWKEWTAYQNEWDHCVEWRDDSEKDGGPGWKLHRDKALYCTVTCPLEKYSTLLIKCRLCRNAQRKPILFDSEHAKADKHLTAVAERTKAVNILKSIFATNLRHPATGQHLTRDPVPGHPCFVLIIKFDEVYKVANIPWVRCLLCGDQHDIDRSADDWEEQVERHKATKGHKKRAWILDTQYCGERGWEEERDLLLKQRQACFHDPIDKTFYTLKSYGEHVLDDSGSDDDCDDNSGSSIGGSVFAVAGGNNNSRKQHQTPTGPDGIGPVELAALNEAIWRFQNGIRPDHQHDSEQQVVLPRVPLPVERHPPHQVVDSFLPSLPFVEPRPPAPAASSFWCSGGPSGVLVESSRNRPNFSGRYLARRRPAVNEKDSDDSA